MSTDTPPPPPTRPETTGQPADPGDRLTTGAAATPGPGPVNRRTRRFRQIGSIALILAGFTMLIVTIRAQDIGLASTAGASLPQLTTGVIGTVLLVTGLALIVQAFEDSEEPPVSGM